MLTFPAALWHNILMLPSIKDYEQEIKLEMLREKLIGNAKRPGYVHTGLQLPLDLFMSIKKEALDNNTTFRAVVTSILNDFFTKG